MEKHQIQVKGQGADAKKVPTYIRFKATPYTEIVCVCLYTVVCIEVLNPNTKTVCYATCIVYTKISQYIGAKKFKDKKKQKFGINQIFGSVSFLSG